MLQSSGLLNRIHICHIYFFPERSHHTLSHVAEYWIGPYQLFSTSHFLTNSKEEESKIQNLEQAARSIVGISGSQILRQYYNHPKRLPWQRLFGRENKGLTAFQASLKLFETSAQPNPQ
jgi:hypothetical protein